MAAPTTSDRFELRRRIGAGGMGVVYEAYDRERDATVALKTLAEARPSEIGRFKREFRALAEVIHPNLVTLYELIADRGDVYFTMELIDGVHFNRWVRLDREPSAPVRGETRRDPSATDAALCQPEESTRSIRPAERAPASWAIDAPRLRSGLRQLAEGVYALHERGMLHRDLKPSNVKVARDGRVVILDFGLVTELAAERWAEVADRPLEGTVSYMSPEQGARQPLGPASDWYSVGVMLFAALTGRMPFLGGKEDVLMDKQRFEPPAAHELNPHAPRDLSALAADLLRRDPDRRPPGHEILRRVGSELAGAHLAEGSVRSQTSSHRIVGRAGELATLRDAYTSACAQAGPLLVQLEGPSGVGKSHVLRSFVRQLADDGALILRSRCYASESVPFKAVDALIDALAEHLDRLSPFDVEGLMPRDALALARVFPVLRQIDAFTAVARRRAPTRDPRELRRRAFGALAELLARLADRTPLVLAIDDLQWGDIDSAALLASILGADDPPNLLLVVSYRSEDREASACIMAFRDQTADAESVHVVLEPLSPDDAAELARVHLDDAGDAAELAAEIARESQGVPFFIEELARRARERGDAEAPTSLAETLRGRLLRLPDEAAALLAHIAVARRPVPRQLAERAAGTRDPGTLALLQAGSLVRSRAVADQRYVEAYHDRVREAAEALLDAEERRAVHLRLARAYEATASPDVEALAHHYGGAGVLDRAAAYAGDAAARAARILAFDRAAELYRLALEWSPEPERGLRSELAEALANAGRGLECAEAYLDAARGAATAEALDFRSRAAWHFLVSGHVERGMDEMGAVLEAVDMAMAKSPRRALAHVAWNRLRLAIRGLRFRPTDAAEVPASRLRKVDVAFAVAEGLGMADVIRAADFQSRHLRLALETGEPRRVARALAGEVVFRSYRGSGNAKATRAALELCGRLVDEVGDPAIRGMYEGARGMAAFNEGRFHDSYPALFAAEAIFRDECVGHRWELATCELFAACALAITGRVREATKTYPRALADAEARGDLYASTFIRACLAFYPQLVRDDPDAAAEEVTEAIARWTPRGYHLQHANALHSLMRIDLYAAEPARAMERCDAEWRALERSLLLRGQLVRGMMLWVRARAALSLYHSGSRERRLLAIGRKASRHFHRESAPWSDAYALAIDADLARAAGDPERLLACLTAAEEASAACELWLNVHTARRTRGILVAGDEGAALVAGADAYFEEQGIVNPEAVCRVFYPSVA